MHISHDPQAPTAPAINFEQFLTVDIRVGRIVEGEPFQQTRKPAYKLKNDFAPANCSRSHSAESLLKTVPQVMRVRRI
jgi:tRNA-binding protein